MKQVIFEKASQHVIHAEEIDDRRIIGYIRGTLKGIVVWDEGQTKFIGVSLVSGVPAMDMVIPNTSMAVSGPANHLSTFMTKVNHKMIDPEIEFYVFDNMADLLMWLK